MAIYLHFLDRELLESVPTPPSAEGINEAIRLAYLFTSEEIYTGLAAAWENPIVTVGMRDEFKLLTRLGILHYASRDSGAEFIAARQDLYSHDKGRYPNYFSKAPSQLVEVAPDWPKPTSSTLALDRYMAAWGGELATQPQTLRFTKMGDPVIKAIRERGDRAVTLALFRPYLVAAGIGNEFTEMAIARQISRGYADGYLRDFDGALITGIPGLVAYDESADRFPSTDYILFRWMASFTGYSRITAGGQASLVEWAAHLGKRGLPSQTRLALTTQAIVRGLDSWTLQRPGAHDVSPQGRRAAVLETLRQAGRLATYLQLEEGGDPELASERAIHHLKWLAQQIIKHQPATSEPLEIEMNRTLDPTVDVILLTVNDAETDALRAELARVTGQPGRRWDGAKSTYWDYGPIGGCSATMLRSGMGSMGTHGATLTVQAAIAERSPSSVIAVGMAFGIDESTQNIGDLLLSQQIASYEPRRVGENTLLEEVVIRRGDRAPSSARLLSRFRDARLDTIGVSVTVGLMLSGEALVDNAAFKAALIKAYPEAIGGEMEGSGVQAAATRENVDWIVVKAICDWAEHKGTNKERRQRIAAEQAAKAVVHVLSSGALA